MTAFPFARVLSTYDVLAQLTHPTLPPGVDFSPDFYFSSPPPFFFKINCTQFLFYFDGTMFGEGLLRGSFTPHSVSIFFSAFFLFVFLH